MDKRAPKRLGHLFVDLTGAMKHPSIGGRHHAMTSIDSCTCMSWLRMPRNNNNTTAALEGFIIAIASLAKHKIEIITTNEEGELEEKIQEDLDSLYIVPGGNLPHSLRRNGMAD